MNLKEIHYGIEIETVKRTRAQIAWAIHSVLCGRTSIPAWTYWMSRGNNGTRIGTGVWYRA